MLFYTYTKKICFCLSLIIYASRMVAPASFTFLFLRKQPSRGRILFLHLAAQYIEQLGGYTLLA